MSTAATPIDTVVPALALDEIQGNILAAFNKDHQRFLFLTITDVARAKTWLGGIIPKISTTRQVGGFNTEFRAARRRNKGEVDMPTASWMSIAFTFAGLSKLNATGLADFPDEFRQGMANRKNVTGDLGRSDPANWQPPFSNPDRVHIIILLAADTLLDVRAARLATIAGFEMHGGLSLLHTEKGEVLPGKLSGHEQFGFKDGVSQPGIKGFTLSTNNNPDPQSGHQGNPGQDLLWPGEFVLGYPTQKPVTLAGFDGPNPEPGPISTSGPAWTVNGSYLVFRKLYQNVAAFHTGVKTGAAALGTTPEIFGAKLVGRFASGCPIQPTAFEVDIDKLPTLAANADDGFPADFDPNAGDPSVLHPELLQDNLINNFEYGSDLAGQWVPRAGHIRKVYPRDEQTLLADGTVDPASKLHESFTQTHRLLRRGIPFGEAFLPKDPSAPPVDDGVDRGLLFLCYQKSIANQFEFVQQSWVNDPNFPQPGDGQDAVMAQSPAGAIGCPFHNQTPTPTPTISHFVVTEGGDYFFQPSISALHGLTH